MEEIEAPAPRRFCVAKTLDAGCKIFSWAIMTAMVVLLVVSRTPLAEKLPVWLAATGGTRKFLLPILASAAVGYLTNAIAIWMLFKPYEKHWFWPQGMIPRNKENFGRELGILIPKHLLQPEKISARIGRVALQYLRDPVFIRNVREKVNKFLLGHSEQLSNVIVPYIQEIAVQAVRENLTEEQFQLACRKIADHFLRDREEREKTVATVAEIIKEVLPQFSAELKAVVAKKVAEAFRREHPILSGLNDVFGSKSVSDEVKDFWSKGEAELLESLGRPETREKIADFIDRALHAGIEWAKKPENAPAVREFIADKRAAAEKYLRDYLAERIPRLADDILGSDTFWTMLREKALPALQYHVVTQLHGDGGALIAKLDIPGKIKNAVDGMDMHELHKFVVQASNDNLTWLQIFGFFLGMIAGGIMAFLL